MSSLTAVSTPDGILAVHNFYREPGGEDRVFEAETQLLEARGHRVFRYTTHNEGIAQTGRIDLVRNAFWNQRTYDDLRVLIRAERPAVMHVHNTFPVLSPSAYAAANAEGVPTVHSLHNFRHLCANGLLFREGAVCDRCVGKSVPWPAVTGRCYRGSLLASAVAAGVTYLYKGQGHWADRIDLYIALTEAGRERFIAGGIPAERIVVKPHFVEDEFGPDRSRHLGSSVLFVGRLSPEKGVTTLLTAWAENRDLPPLVIIGSGPLEPLVAEACSSDKRVRWLGHQSHAEVMKVMGGARCLVVPSLWEEPFGLVAIEAFSAGVPVIASDQGALRSLITPSENGLLHKPGDVQGLAAALRCMMSSSIEWGNMGARARERYETDYTPARNYQMLLAIYERARLSHGSRGCRGRARG